MASLSWSLTPAPLAAGRFGETRVECRVEVWYLEQECRDQDVCSDSSVHGGWLSIKQAMKKARLFGAVPRCRLAASSRFALHATRGSKRDFCLIDPDLFIGKVLI
eukprot:7388839-Prymnesium_polylepis.1